MADFVLAFPVQIFNSEDHSLKKLNQRFFSAVNLRRISGAVIGFVLLAATPVLTCSIARAETCRRQIVNGVMVTICCDCNGVCYRKK